MITIVIKCNSELIEDIKQGKCNSFLFEENNAKNGVHNGDRFIFVDSEKGCYVESNISKINNCVDSFNILTNTPTDMNIKYISYKNNNYRVCNNLVISERNDKNLLLIKIKPCKYSFEDSVILLDTNIIIERESGNNVQESVVQALKGIQESKGKLFICKEIKDELSKHKDNRVVELMHIKLKSYNELKNEDFYPDNFFRTTIEKINDKNDVIDNILLGFVYNNKCDFLITNDKGIKTKAEKLYLDNRVLSSYDVLSKLDRDNIALNEYINSNIRLSKFSEIPLNDDFFDSFKKDYDEDKFTKWFKSKVNEDCFVYKKDGKINGFLYLKIENEYENYDDFIMPFKTKKRRLKIGTFKIISSGERLGEKFLQIIIDTALQNKIDEIYVTLFDNDRKELQALKNILLDWGFVIYTKKKSNGELVLTKTIEKYDYSKSIKQNYPLYRNNPEVYYLPIIYEYHDRMFPNPKNYINQNLFKYERAVNNALEKIYITKVNWKENMAPGNLLMIYQMGEDLPYRSKRYTSRLTNIGIFEEIIKPETINDFLKICKNRTVFSKNELENFYNKGYRTIIKFIHLKQLQREIVLDTLWNENIIDHGKGPRVLDLVSVYNYKRILELSGG